jgi:hypothetical protein
MAAWLSIWPCSPFLYSYMAFLFARAPEVVMRGWRWVLLLGWLLLLVSLFLPSLSLPLALAPDCVGLIADQCAVHRQPGNRLFWGTVVPAGVLLIGVISHEFWRRICPLSFVAQLGRSLG